jgi:hypothetical protein
MRRGIEPCRSDLVLELVPGGRNALEVRSPHLPLGQSEGARWRSGKSLSCTDCIIE